MSDVTPVEVRQQFIDLLYAAGAAGMTPFFGKLRDSIRINVQPHGRRWGGLHIGISNNTATVTPVVILRITDRTRFTEYPSFISDPEIGGFCAPGHLVRLAAAAHELAHVIQHWQQFASLFDLDGNFDRERVLELLHQDMVGDHDEEWQGIYRQLRVEFVNPLINVARS